MLRLAFQVKKKMPEIIFFIQGRNKKTYRDLYSPHKYEGFCCGRQGNRVKVINKDRDDIHTLHISNF